MTIKHQRTEHVAQSIEAIKAILRPGVTLERLHSAKAVLMALCARKTLFPRAEFPVPTPEEIDRTFLIYQEPNGGYALYVNSALTGQRSAPHDHGGSWAIVAAIEGEEIHHLYEARPEDRLRELDPVVVKPGTAVALMPQGIHAIQAVAEEPLLHLHLYGAAFEHQTERRVFDLESGTVRRFVLDDVGFVEDAR
ncbi:MAG: cysteine dioxygenase family protein [Pseudomonadota bacterium]